MSNNPELLLCGRNNYVGPNGEGPCHDGDVWKDATNLVERSVIYQNPKELEQLTCPIGYDLTHTPIRFGLDFATNLGNKKGLFDIGRIIKYPESDEKPRRNRAMVACKKSKFRKHDMNTFENCCDNTYRNKSTTMKLSQKDAKTISLNNKSKCMEDGTTWNTGVATTSCKTINDKMVAVCNQPKYFTSNLCKFHFNDINFPERRAQGDKYRKEFCDKNPTSTESYCTDKSKEMPYTYVFPWNSIFPPVFDNFRDVAKRPPHPGLKPAPAPAPAPAPVITNTVTSSTTTNTTNTASNNTTASVTIIEDGEVEVIVDKDSTTSGGAADADVTNENAEINITHDAEVQTFEGIEVDDDFITNFKKKVDSLSASDEKTRLEYLYNIGAELSNVYEIPNLLQVEIDRIDARINIRIANDAFKKLEKAKQIATIIEEITDADKTVADYVKEQNDKLKDLPDDEREEKIDTQLDELETKGAELLKEHPEVSHMTRNEKIAATMKKSAFDQFLHIIINREKPSTSNWMGYVILILVFIGLCLVGYVIKKIFFGKKKNKGPPGRGPPRDDYGRGSRRDRDDY